MRLLGRIVAPVALATLGIACSQPADRPAADLAPAAAVVSPDRPAPAAGSAHHRKHEDRREPVVASAPPLRLDVTVNGVAVSWHQDSFDKVARYTKGSDGEARDVWSLRELARTLIGSTARVTSVTGDDGTRIIDPVSWDDQARTPLLHTTRRGTLKFRWADAGGKWGESEVKDVTRIDIAL